MLRVVESIFYATVAGVATPLLVNLPFKKRKRAAPAVVLNVFLVLSCFRGALGGSGSGDSVLK
jgi:VIT1/CCC1 family predicted Fe2+/Mn2+ transporter